jgi:hypothetical protein
VEFHAVLQTKCCFKFHFILCLDLYFLLSSPM